MRERFLARFGDDHRSVEEYREEIAQLFEQHADPVVFEEIDEKYNWIDGAHDHYAKTIQTALDGYADCILASDPTPEEFDTYAGVLEARAMTEPPINDEQF